jgi:hypothetical protein
MRPLVETGKQGSAVFRCVRSGRGHFLSSASCARKVSVERGIPSASTCLTANFPLVKASATYGTRAKPGTWNDFQWHAE